MKKSTIALISAVAVLAAAAGGGLALRGDSASSAEGISGTAGGSLDLSLLAQSVGIPIADGSIAAGEYRNSLHDPQTGMTIFWQNDAANIYVGLISPGTGWAGVGFSDRAGKPGSNIIIGAVSDGKVTIQDSYGVTKELHLVDWTPSLFAAGGSEASGQTVLEFGMPLASGDAQDVALVPGHVVQVMLAYQATKDSFTVEHTRYSMTQITLD
jgi:hypothetical protein